MKYQWLMGGEMVQLHRGQISYLELLKVEWQVLLAVQFLVGIVQGVQLRLQLAGPVRTVLVLLHLQ
jgi:hypothetical protein